MSDCWQVDKRWADRFLPEIKQTLGLYLIGEPPIEEDAERNTDLMVLRMDAVRIGCRIRKFDYTRKYANEFTIRAGRPSGAKTELTKIIEGWGDYFFYGFADEESRGLCAWALADLRVFRRWYMEQLYRGSANCAPGQRQNNRDGSSYFIAFNWADMPHDMIVARKRLEEMAA